MKVFKYKFTRLTKIFIYIGIALCIVGLGLNVYSLITSDILSAANIFYPVLQHILMFLVPVILLVILVGLVFSSYYSIDGNTLKTSFGIIKSRYDVNDIETVLLDRTTNKLTVSFKNKNFIVIVVREEWYDEFIDALCKANNQIEYTIKSKENTDDKEEKK